jgi:DtxR family Mn-dependent transcriptional regulator
MMHTLNLSESTEMYLKALIELSARKTATVSRLAGRLGVTQVSANEMVRRLTDQGLMTHTPYKGVNLTEKGLEIGSNVMRRQRLWECFLYDHLKIEWARLYELTCNLEHATAPEVTEALADFLGQPSHCPHGNPIPDPDGKFEPLNGTSLSEMSLGSTARILAIRETSTEVLQHLSQHDILPDRQVTLLEAAPLEGPLTLQIGDTQVAVGLLVADLVLVQPIQQ